MTILCSAEEASRIVIVIGKQHARRAPRPISGRGPTIIGPRRPQATMCPTCRGAREVEVNPTGEVGASEFVPCPTCRS